MKKLQLITILEIGRQEQPGKHVFLFFINFTIRLNSKIACCQERIAEVIVCVTDWFPFGGCDLFPPFYLIIKLFVFRQLKIDVRSVSRESLDLQSENSIH